MREPRLLTLAVLAAALVIGLPPLLGPGLTIERLEGDVLHLLDGAERLRAGALPHLDFSTPLGVLGFAAVALPRALGAGAGQALLLADLLAALVLLPGLVWLWRSRIGGLAGLGLGLWVVVETLAVTSDSAIPGTTFATHYNRWGWAVFGLLALLLALPPRAGPGRAGPGPGTVRADGLMLGVGLSILALLKASFFVALLPAVILWWWLGAEPAGPRPGPGLVPRRRRDAEILVALATGAAAMLLVTLWAGTPRYWLAYAGDLAAVGRSALLLRPGLSPGALIEAPRVLAAVTVLLLSVLLLARSGAGRMAALLAALAPGMLFATYHNWGHAQLWLVPLALLLLHAAGQGLSGRRVGRLRAGWLARLLALAAVVLIAPVLFNMAASPLRSIVWPVAGRITPLTIPGGGDLGFRDTPARQDYVRLPEGFGPGAGPGDLLDRLGVRALRFGGEEIPPCTLRAGFVSLLGDMARSVDAVPGLAGRDFLTVDLVDVTWMVTGGEPPRQGSLWYYGGRAGLDAADWLLVPRCALSARARNAMLAELARDGDVFTLRHADRVALVFERTGGAGQGPDGPPRP